MSFIESITNFLSSLFNRNTPEAQKRALLKKLDNEIKLYNPVICKNGMMQPNFAEAVFVLYKYTRCLDDLFSMTIGASDLPRRRRFESQLVLTGYSAEEQEQFDSLTFEQRKAEIIADGGDSHRTSRIYESQRRKNEKLIKTLNTEPFKNMDREILQLQQLVDFCHTNFLPVLQIFDSNFIPGDFNYSPTYTEVPIEKMENVLEDFYYQIYGLRITTGTANAAIALAQMIHGGELPEEQKETYMSAMKKVAYVITKIIPADKLKTLIKYTKADEVYEPKHATYSGSPRNNFAQMMQEKFDTDEQRIKAELQDEQIEQELSSLFTGMELSEAGMYNNQYNEVLQQNSSLSFQWILPLRILKTFLKVYVPDTLKSLLDNLAIEGFFSNPNYKSNFSTTVYAVLGAEEKIASFEASFDTDQPNSIAVLQSYINDSHRDHDFYKKLELMVHKINDEAHELIQTETTNLISLYHIMGELITDAKKPSSEIIENLKVLMMSSRNREHSIFMEQTYPTWKIFFEIMKNYVIINTGEKN